jgi:hypothetical protein
LCQMPAASGACIPNAALTNLTLSLFIGSAE